MVYRNVGQHQVVEAVGGPLGCCGQHHPAAMCLHTYHIACTRVTLLAHVSRSLQTCHVALCLESSIRYVYVRMHMHAHT
jgi:hypothetical protein